MATQLTAEDARQSLTAHVAAKGIEAFVKYGAVTTRAGLDRILADRTIVRYPCRLCLAADRLQVGEFAHVEPDGGQPEDGFTLFVHPLLASDPALLAHAALYQLVVVNYGEFASSEEAETFGAAALGLTRDEYYATLCALSDQLAGIDAGAEDSSYGGCGLGCTCGSGCE